MRHSETPPTEKMSTGATTGGVGPDQMQTTFRAAVESYLRAKPLSRGTRNEYFSTLRKWEEWGGIVPIEEMRRRNIRTSSRSETGRPLRQAQLATPPQPVRPPSQSAALRPPLPGPQLL